MSDEVFGPFSRDQIARATLGPFANASLLEEERPLHEELGVGKADIRNLLATNPEFKELLSAPEADGLRSYLDGTEKYDIGVLNNLVMELLDGMKARKVQVRTSRPRPSLSRRPSGPPRTLSGPGSGLVLPQAYTPAARRPGPSTMWFLEQPKKG